MDTATLKQRFLAECEIMDPVKDTFSKVLDRAGLADGEGLTRGELAVLHGNYLEAVRQGLRKRANRGPSGQAHV